jgi:hypothetical protein
MCCYRPRTPERCQFPDQRPAWVSVRATEAVVDRSPRRHLRQAVVAATRCPRRRAPLRAARGTDGDGAAVRPGRGCLVRRRPLEGRVGAARDAGVPGPDGARARPVRRSSAGATSCGSRRSRGSAAPAAPRRSARRGRRRGRRVRARRDRHERAVVRPVDRRSHCARGTGVGGSHPGGAEAERAAAGVPPACSDRSARSDRRLGPAGATAPGGPADRLGDLGQEDRPRRLLPRSIAVRPLRRQPRRPLGRAPGEGRRRRRSPDVLQQQGDHERDASTQGGHRPGGLIERHRPVQGVRGRLRQARSGADVRQVEHDHGVLTFTRAAQ